MIVLWITTQKVDIDGRVVSSGGWMQGALRNLAQEQTVQVINAFPCTGDTVMQIAGTVQYRTFSPLKNQSRYSKETERDIYALITEVNPDVIHVWGTETPVALASVNAAEQAGMIDRVLINIQGIITLIEKATEATGIPLFYRMGFRPKEIYEMSGVNRLVHSMQKRARFEELAIKKVSHVAGRTDLDRAFVRRLNSHCTYHFCNETLREEFYKAEKWTLDKMTPHRIFMSGAHYPLKGLHKLIEALAIVKQEYSDTILYVAGEDMFATRQLGKKPYDLVPPLLRRDGYQSYLWHLAAEYDVKDNIIFVGSLDAKKMIREYLKANVFVSVSIIENSPNSLNEAKFLGVPCVAAYTGGTVSRMTDGVDGLFFPWNEPWQMADRILRIFNNDVNLDQITNNAIRCEERRCSNGDNKDELMHIYKNIITKRQHGRTMI